MEVAIAFSRFRKFVIENFEKSKSALDLVPLAVSPFSTPNQ